MDERKRRLALQKRREALLRKKRQKQERILIFTASLIILCVLIVLLILLLSKPKGDQTIPEPTPLPTTAPTATPVPSYIGKADIQTYTSKYSDYLPLIKKADTTEKVIAITIDDLDLNLKDNLEEIIEIAINYNVKLTLFPIGNQLHDSSIRNSLLMAFSRGFEIENHTMNHEQVYKLSNENFYNTVVDQQKIVSQSLGVDYQPHFFRLPGGNGTVDPRTHFYLKRLGYKALLDWSISGSDLEIEKIKSRLEPGSIILFHTTSGDLRKIKKLIPYAIGQGYRIVTLNELLSYDENLCYALGSQSIPEFVPYEYDQYIVMQKGQKAYCILLMQERLTELGYLPADSVADGDFGSQTEEAVKRFQIVHGLDATGIANIDTQTILFSENARHNGF